MTKLQRYAERIGWLVIAIVIMIAAATILTVALTWPDATTPQHAQWLSRWFYGPLSAIGLTAAVAVCVLRRPGVARAERMATLATRIAVGGTLVGLIAGGIGLAGSGGVLAGGLEFLGMLVVLSLPIASCIVLQRLRVAARHGAVGLSEVMGVDLLRDTAAVTVDVADDQRLTRPHVRPVATSEPVRPVPMAPVPPVERAVSDQQAMPEGEAPRQAS